MATAQDEYNELFRDKSRRGPHPEDAAHANDGASFLASDSDNDSDRTPAASTHSSSPNPSRSQSTSTYRVPTTRHQANTGVKGVITDAQAYRDAARSARPSVSASRTSLQNYTPDDTTHWNKENNSHSLDDLDEQDVEDESFMTQWRQQRLASLASGTKILGGKRRDRDAVRARYGAITPVDGEGYLDAVDGSGAVTVVVVFIWDDRSEVSDLVEEALSPLARKYVNTRFVKLHYEDAEMEPAGVPALLAYRAGEKFAGLVPIVDELPDDAELNPGTLERVMQRHQIL